MNKIVKMVILGLVAFIILIALITGSNILFFWSLFNGFQNLIMVTGIDPTLTKAIASILLALVVMLPLGKLLLSFTPIPQKYKKPYRALVFIFIGIFFVFSYFGTRNAFFDPSKGTPLKYYSVAPDGKIRFFTVPGFDPETGDTLLPVTKEIIFKSKGFKVKNNEPAKISVPPTIIHGKKEISLKEQEGISNPVQPHVDSVKTLSDVEMLLYLAQKRAEYDRRTGSSSNMNIDVREEEISPDSSSALVSEIESEPVSHRPKTLTELGVSVSSDPDQDNKLPAWDEAYGRVTPEYLSISERRDAYLSAIQEAGGYAISIIHNPQASELGEVFKSESFYSCYSSSFNACETTIDNYSNGTFEFYDEKKILLFKIPPRKKIVILLELKTYYFKLPESSKFIQFNVPKRRELNVKILGDATIERGEVITGAISDSNI